MDTFKALEGKTIAKAELVRSAMQDDIGRLRLDFTDGTTLFLVAGFGNYTGESVDEYPTTLKVVANLEDYILPALDPHESDPYAIAEYLTEYARTSPGLPWENAAILNEYVTFAECEGTVGEGLGAVQLKSGRRISAQKHHKTGEWAFFVDAG
ncbi:MAG: hypothetical protein HC795_06055 [Coleofasciculaceae cyanobacterium RL_1_1]|nr:hypothetical protein [Coleofasciculaceae cyanobacterium RL_1_1]